MIAVANQFSASNTHNRELEYLLLGDLRQILEAPPEPETSLWLLAILDMILANRPPILSSATLPATALPASGRPARYPPRSSETASMIDKLRRLRDRVAHRSGHAALANEIRADLREVMRDRVNSAGCLYDN